jgi:hypothetical protein
MWNTFIDDPIRRREVRPEKIPIPERPQDLPSAEPVPVHQPESEPEHAPA